MTCTQAPTPLVLVYVLVGGPANHKQTSLASYSSEVVTTPWSSSVRAAMGASFCQDGL